MINDEYLFVKCLSQCIPGTKAPRQVIIASLLDSNKCLGVLIMSQKKEFAVKIQTVTNSSISELNFYNMYKHANIVDVYRTYVRNNLVYIDMELGVSLHKLAINLTYTECDWVDVYLIQNIPFIKRLSNRRELQKNIINGVKYLHSVNIIHLDLKLDNVIVVNGIAKIIDFGLCDTVVSDKILRSTKVQTTSYRCPEFLNSKEKGMLYTFEPDIWSVGVMLLELETGLLAFPPDKCGIQSISNSNNKTEKYCYGSPSSTDEDSAENVLWRITLVLGTLEGEEIANFYTDIEGAGFGMIDPEIRKHIENALQLHPNKRILLDL